MSTHEHTHSCPSPAVAAACSRGVIAPPNHYCALLSHGHQTLGSQQFRTLSHKTKWNPIRGRTTEMNLLSDLSDQNYFQYKFSVKGLAVFSCKIPKAGCGLQGPYFLRGPVSAKPMIMKVPVHLLLPLVKMKNKKTITFIICFWSSRKKMHWHVEIRIVITFKNIWEDFIQDLSYFLTNAILHKPCSAKTRSWISYFRKRLP